MMKIKYTILLLMLIAAVSKAWAEATVSILPSENGTVTYGMSGSTVTLTVTPDENYFLHESDLKVRMSVDGGNADARTRTGVNPGLTDYLAVTNNHNGTFTFILPDKDYEYVAHVTAVFRPVTVELSANSFTYNAAVQKPTLTVTFNGSTLTSTTDFLATYSGNCKDAGDYTVTITGKGEYVGTTSAFPYTIAPKTVGLTWSTPQTFVYDGTAKMLSATATGVESGDECTVTVICNAVPYYGYTATAGDQRPNYNTLIQHLVDNNLNTKWCPEWGTTKSGVLYVEFHTEEPIYPIGYTFYTGDDTSTFPSRNPRSWRLLARKTESDGWTAIATVENNMSIGFVNKTPYDFSLDVVGESYKYYRFEVSEHRDDQYDYFSSQHQLQLQDFHLNVPDDRNAGTHTAYATALSNPNYALPEVKSQSFTITPRPVTLTWDNTGTGETKLIYNGSAYIPTATAGNLVGEDVCTVTVTGEQINVGDYTATASALSNSNYKLPDDPTQSFTISPKAIGDGSATPAANITLTGIDESYVYTGSELQPSVTLAYAQLPGEDKAITASGNYLVSYSDANHDNVNVANGGIVTITGTGNYTGNIVKTFIITPKSFSTDAITIATISNQIYNGTELTPVVTLHDVVRDVDLAAEDFTVTKHKDAGTHTVTITAKGNYQATLTAPFTIDPKVVTLEWQEVKTFEYDGTAKVLTATATGVESGDECTVTVTYNKTPYYGYTATAGVERISPDHRKEYLVDGNTSTKWTVTRSQRDNGIWWVEFNTSTPIYPVGYTLMTGDDTQTLPSRNPKSWKLKARKDTNDEWTVIASVTDDHRLEAKNLEEYDYDLDVVGESYMYYRFEVSDRRTEYTDATSSNDEMQLQDFHLNVTDVTSPKDVGSHTAYATALSNPNYALPEVKSQSFTITPRPVTLTWDNTGTGETKLIYNGSAYIPTATAGNLVEGDECTVTVTGEQINVGDYTATASALSNSNYKLPDDPTQSFTISPKAIGDGSATPATDITLTGIDESYVYTGSELQPVVTLTYDQLPGTDKTIAAASNYTVTYTDEDHDNLTVAKGGILTITGEGNYTGSIVKTFGITPKPFSTNDITIAEIPHQTYNGTELTPAVTLHDVARDVDLDVADFTVTKHKDAGTHTVTITAQGNYQAELTAPFTIEPKTVELAWSNLVFDYDGTDKLASAEVSNLEGEDECAVTVTGSASAVGVHTATATALDNTNYQLPTDDADKQTTFEILKIFSYGANKTWMTFFDGAEDLEFKDGEEDKIETYVVTEASGSTVTVVNTGGKIYQNVPMLLKRTGEETIIRAHKAESLAALSATPFENFYGGVTDLTNYKNVYVLVGSEFLPTTGTTIDAERCFLALGGMVTAPTRMVIVVDNETTGLTPCPIPMVEGSYWYTLDGRKLSGIPAKKGMYIWNGKKVVIK